MNWWVLSSVCPVPEKKSQRALEHLRWMLQKDLLGQDMFLIGRPGPERRRLALEFLELTGREVEFVSLSRDTTEADLKQRRELRNGTAKFYDQVPHVAVFVRYPVFSPSVWSVFLSFCHPLSFHSNKVRLGVLVIFKDITLCPNFLDINS